jgi:methionyl aminopeptidase
MKNLTKGRNVSILQNILHVLKLQAVEGATGLQLDAAAAALLRLHNVESAFLNYTPGGNAPAEGFPNVLCVSINGEVIHGIPDERKFEYGDVVKLDLGLKEKRVCGEFCHGADSVPEKTPCVNCGDQKFYYEFDDGALTVIVGERAGSATARRLVAATEEALNAGIAQAKSGKITFDIARAIKAVADREGFAVIQGYTGHGIGKTLHQAPDVPNEPIGVPVKLEVGMRLAIEPMFSSTKGYTIVDKKNKWTVKLIRGGVAAHFERTVTVG